ncbi:MAG: hypothetical protein WCS99_07390 [Limisphaerales bacterium]
MKLWEWLLDLLDFVDIVEHWRFALVMLVAGVVAFAFYHFLPEGGLRTFLVAALFVFGLISGIVWERSG